MKKTLSTLALSLFAFAGIAQAADITCRWKAGCATKSTACHCA